MKKRVKLTRYYEVNLEVGKEIASITTTYLEFSELISYGFILMNRDEEERMLALKAELDDEVVIRKDEVIFNCNIFTSNIFTIECDLKDSIRLLEAHKNDI